MEILGHATMRMTMERYGHALPERMRAASDAMDDLLARAAGDADEREGSDNATEEEAGPDQGGPSDLG